MNSVVAKIREKFPGVYDEVPDDELTQRIADKYPAYLDVEDFAREYKVGVLKREQAVVADAAERAGAKADRIQAWSDYVLGPLEAIPRTAAQVVGGVGNYLGGVAAGAMKDVVTGQVPTPFNPNAPAMPNLSQAIVGGETQEDVGTSVVNQGLVEGASALGPIGVGMAASAAGVPPAVAFGGSMGAATFQATGDPVAASESALLGAVTPGTADLGRQAAASVLGVAVNRGLLSGQRALTQKAVEALGAQGAIQALFEGVKLPQYAAMDPEERKQAIARSLIANTAFMALDVPAIVDGRPSLTQRQQLPQSVVAEAVNRAVNDPGIIEALRDSVDDEVVRSFDPQNAQWREPAWPPTEPGFVNPANADWRTAPKPVPESAATLADLPANEPMVQAAAELRRQEEPPPPEGGVTNAEVQRKETIADIDYSEFDTAGGMPASGERETADVEFPYGPEPPGAAPVPVVETTIFDPSHVPTVEVPIKDISLSSDVPNFKGQADVKTGIVPGQQLEGTYERVGTAPIVVWRRQNGQLEVITGRHRLDLARRSGEQTIPAQVVSEADGFTREMALTFDAASNIRDGQGSIEEYAKFFRFTPKLTQEEAGRRGLLARAKGRAGWDLGRLASDDLYALYQSGKITEAQALVIARTVPNDGPKQHLGSKLALDGRPADYLRARLERERAKAATATQRDMFGHTIFDDTHVDEETERLLEIRRSLSQQIRAAEGAAKNAEAAAQLGVDVPDPSGTLKRVAALKAEQTRWDGHWWLQPDLLARVKGEQPKPPAEAPKAAKPPAGGELFDAGDMPFNLAGEKAKAPPETAKPPETTTQFGAETFSQQEMFNIEKIVESKDPKKSADAAEAMYGGPGPAAARITKHLAALDADPVTRRAFTKEQRTRLKEVIALLNQRAKPPGGGGGGVKASPGYASPGGELGGAAEREPPGSRPPEDSPTFSVFDALAMELPEAVRMVHEFTGAWPKVVEKIRALGGRAMGVFRFTEGPEGKGRVELRTDTADLLTPAEKADLMEQARDFAKAVAGPGDNAAKIAADRYEYLLKKAYEEARTRNPIQALKTIWHDIGHVVDWLPERMIQGRGNLFGRIASLKNFLKHVLPLDPTKPVGERLKPSDEAALRRQAEKQLRDELGPIEEIVKEIIVDEPQWEITGVTVKDILDIMGETAGRSTPELARWFAEQSRQVKASILRAAMKGMVDERLAAMGTKKQVGTRQVKRTVREKVGREPTSSEIKERFAKLLAEEIRRRNLAELKAVKAELEPLIAWWRGTERMEDYFKPSAEMYAEAFSAFINNPAAVLKRAPTYYRLMMNYMDRKPEVAKLYGEIQNQIKSGTIMPERVTRLRGMWDRDDERSMKGIEERLRRQSLFSQSGRADYLDNVQYHFDRIFGPIYRRIGDYPLAGKLRGAIGDFLYRASEHERFLQRSNALVGQKLLAGGFDWNDFAEFGFHHRVAMERFNIFNPHGWTSKNSLERLAEMRRDYGPERWAIMESAYKEFRHIYEEQVTKPLRESGMYDAETQQKIDDNVWYMTFAAVKDGKPVEGIDALLNQRFGSDVGPRIYRQIGNLGEIKNPATATVLKALSLISAYHRNNVKRETVAMLLAQHGNTEIRPAETVWSGKGMKAVVVETDKVGTVIFLRDGKPQAFYVRKVIADALNGGNPVDSKVALGMMRATSGLKAAFTQLNYAFWPVNYVRDTMGWLAQLPGAGPVDYLREFPSAMRAARESLSKRKVNPDADAALRRHMLISRADPHGIRSRADNEYELRQLSFGLDPIRWNKEGRQVSKLVSAWNWYREVGQSFERVNKIAGMKYLDRAFPNMPEWQRAEIVRERAGSPDFLQKGASNAYIDWLLMFYNPWKESLRSLAHAARDNPYSLTGKIAGGVMMPTLLQAAAVQGAFGDDTRKKYRSIPDYDLTNYLCIPLGWADELQGKVAYLRLPLWEPARIAHGLVTRLATGRGEGYIQYLGGQVPSVNPLFKVPMAWYSYAVAGHNPYDWFRGKTILDENTYQAGGVPAAKAMAKWTWNEAGGSIFHRFQDPMLESPPRGDVEKFLRLPIVNNALGRWIKVSDRGIADADKRITAPIEKERAQIRLAVREMVRKLNDHETVTDNERKLLMIDGYAQQYMDDLLPRVTAERASPLYRRLQKIPSTRGRAAVLSQEQP